MLFVAAGGCHEYHWTRDYQGAEELARAQHKTLFIFYKWWRDSDSNRMLSSEVLSDPAVAGLFQDTINVLIDRDFGPAYVQYVARYGVNTVPAAVLVAPDGRFQVRTGYIPRDRFIEFVERARSAPADRPSDRRPRLRAP